MSTSFIHRKAGWRAESAPAFVRECIDEAMRVENSGVPFGMEILLNTIRERASAKDAERTVKQEARREAKRLYMRRKRAANN